MGTPTYIPLATITLASTDSEIVLSGIPATYRDLIVVLEFAGAETSPALRFNGDTGSNYSVVGMAGKSWAPTTFSYSSTGTSGGLTFTADTNWRNSFVVQVQDYSATDKHKPYLCRANHIGGSQTLTEATAGRWANTTAINSVTITSSGYTAAYPVGTTCSLYGIA